MLCQRPPCAGERPGGGPTAHTPLTITDLWTGRRRGCTGSSGMQTPPSYGRFSGPPRGAGSSTGTAWRETRPERPSGSSPGLPTGQEDLPRGVGRGGGGGGIGGSALWASVPTAPPQCRAPPLGVTGQVGRAHRAAWVPASPPTDTCPSQGLRLWPEAEQPREMASQPLGLRPQTRPGAPACTSLPGSFPKQKLGICCSIRRDPAQRAPAPAPLPRASAPSTGVASGPGRSDLGPLGVTRGLPTTPAPLRQQLPTLTLRLGRG